ncbi:MAG: M28 family peptidase [Clostridia bacterium]|nr:M28 family peptidase [Clostridia bacterium]
MNLLDYLNEAYPARKSEEEKKAFRTYVEEHYGARTEVTKDGKNRNLVIGDPETANILCTAHYDTPAAALFPNLMIPRNSVLFYLYQFLIVGVLLAVSLLGGWLVELAVGREEAFFLAFLVFYYLGFYLLFFGFKNKHNANDNTSGVATVLTLAEQYKGSQVAFILFDNEEGGKKGSKAFRKDHKDAMQDKFLLNFDCVGNGENILFIAQKKAEAHPELSRLKKIFAAEGAYAVHFYPEKGSQCNSDHKNFPCGVGCMACRRTKGGLFYTPYIHTAKDTVASWENVRYLAERVGEFLAETGE